MGITGAGHQRRRRPVPVRLPVATAGPAPTHRGSRPTGLVNWGTRIPVQDPSQLAVQRFNSAGEAEAVLISGALAGLAESQAHRSSLVLLGWRIGLALCLLAAIAGLCLGALHRVRSLVYKSCRERGAEPIDKLADSIEVD